MDVQAPVWHGRGMSMFPTRIRKTLWAIICAVILAGTGGAAGAAEIRAFEIRITAGKVAGEQVIRVTKGDRVRLNWQADEAMVLHLHGYDIEFKVGTGAGESAPFEAFATGRFPVTSHGSGHAHRPLMYLEVHPD